MSKVSLKNVVMVMAVAMTSLCFGADPTYQVAPPSGTYLASGVADLVGPGGKAYVEYWAWMAQTVITLHLPDS